MSLRPGCWPAVQQQPRVGGTGGVAGNVARPQPQPGDQPPQEAVHRLYRDGDRFGLWAGRLNAECNALFLNFCSSV